MSKSKFKNNLGEVQIVPNPDGVFRPDRDHNRRKLVPCVLCGNDTRANTAVCNNCYRQFQDGETYRKANEAAAENETQRRPMRVVSHGLRVDRHYARNDVHFSFENGVEKRLLQAVLAISEASECRRPDFWTAPKSAIAGIEQRWVNGALVPYNRHDDSWQLWMLTPVQHEAITELAALIAAHARDNFEEGLRRGRAFVLGMVEGEVKLDDITRAYAPAQRRKGGDK